MSNTISKDGVMMSEEFWIGFVLGVLLGAPICFLLMLLWLIWTPITIEEVKEVNE